MSINIIIDKISWCDENGDKLESEGLPDNVIVPVIKIPVKYTRVKGMMYATPEDVSDAVWKYLFDRFGAFPDAYDLVDED